MERLSIVYGTGEQHHMWWDVTTKVTWTLPPNKLLKCTCHSFFLILILVTKNFSGKITKSVTKIEL